MNSSKKDKNLSFWTTRRNKISTSVGKWTGGEDVICHGHLMMKDLLGNISYMQMLVLNITGRLVDEKVAKWLEGNFIGVSYPDVRIWCNTIGALAGTTKTSVVSATVAGTLAADSRGYGGSQTSVYGMKFIQNALKQKQSGMTLEQIIKNANYKNGKPVITGYARPVARNDERLEPHQRMTEKLGFSVGEHLKLAWEINDYLEQHHDLAMNVAGYSCAFLSDQGFSPQEVYRIKSLMVASGVTACYVDYYERTSGSFLPQRCDDIEYDGHPIRTID
ncbi:citrate/2-methylcitrate synthase [Aliikangiella coralliicola]|uniref:Uncharacterized protein n=1 Tax=Aliikangiella coralliicola TaxID=2592383 RepID=A0A545U577_9GAMM|nr:citrate/2-methylcitrate synthase [Aliikangiella coralliicola]TQV84563.1 hypothetical protein FLL46_23415 [Aliikangiella coralliicola]